MSNVFLLISLALVLVVGIFTGVLVMLLLQNRQKKSEGSPQAETKGRYTPVANLWRDPASGKLLVEREGRILSSALSLNEDQRKDMQSAAQELSAWTGLPAAAQPTPQISSTRAELPPQPEKAFNREQFFDPEPAAEAIPLAATVVAAQPAVPAAPRSIVMQIDEVLQEMLAKTNLANSAVRLAEEPRHGVIVWVGIQRYEGIDSVPDENVRAIIRAAVKEWEKRSAAGSNAPDRRV